MPNLVALSNRMVIRFDRATKFGMENSPFSSLAVAVIIASTHCAYPRRDGQAELALVAGYVVR